MAKTERVSIVCRFFTRGSFEKIRDTLLESYRIVLLTQNTAEKRYLLAADSVATLVDEWNGVCEGLPENDAPVYQAWVDGEPLSISEETFESVLQQLTA